jgi:hypothetical protein
MSLAVIGVERRMSLQQSRPYGLSSSIVCGYPNNEQEPTFAIGFLALCL